MQLTTVQPLWLIIPCLLVGVGVAWLSYRNKRQDVPGAVVPWLFAIRALAVALVAFLLLEPMLRYDQREVRKPVVVIAHDGSASLLAAGDTAFLRQRYPTALQELAEALSQDHEVRTFTYGDGVKEGLDHSQSDALTDLSQLFRNLQERLGGSELGAVIMDGDGITNRGRDPRLDAQKLGVPVYTIALGDTTVRPDLIIKEVEYNSITYLGNSFPVLVRVQAYQLKGRSTELQVIHLGKVVARREVPVTNASFMMDVPLELKADAVGPQRYTIRLVAVDGERTASNNERSIIVEVLDDRQRVLVLGAAPHPDLGAIRQALTGLEGYAVELAYANGPAPDLKDADLLVLHGLPSTRYPITPLLEQAAVQRLPTLFVVAHGTDLQALGRSQAAVTMTGARSAITDALPALNDGFPLFTLESDLARTLDRFPPLQVPFATYVLGRSAHALVVQRIGVVSTDQPLVAFAQDQERRTGVICGEGLWRWRLADQRLNGDHSRSDQLVHRMVQFLALKENKDPFRVGHEAVYSAQAQVRFSAELYNANLEAINTPDVQMQLTDSAGQELSYVFDRSGQAYTLDAGRLAPGAYSWRARTTFNGGQFTKSGLFYVQVPQLERNNTVADHALLADISALTNGNLVTTDNMSRLPELLSSRPGLQARSYVRSKYNDLIGVKALFAVLLSLLALEWFIRRRSGSY
ncbi:MAG: hypothetical protein KA817_08530 [Flavobacteriales bacterium]|nr:hypothetical protein [Flavobacteriales bacterium]